MTKARTKAAKKRQRRGKPADATTREPNGDLSRRKEAVAARRTLSEREIKETVQMARMRVHGLEVGLCDRTEAGYVLGRLYLNRHISRIELEAGNRMAEDFFRYYGLTGIPFPNARAQDLFRIHGMPGESRGDAARKAANRAQAIETVLGMVDEAGRPVTTCVKRVVLSDDDSGMMAGHMLAFLRRGLRALVDHYQMRIDDTRKSA